MQTRIFAFIVSTALVPHLLQAQTPTLLEAFQAKVVAKYGAMKLTINSGEGTQRFDLLLSDKRFHGMTVGLPDSARLIAKFVVANLPGTYHPDSIVVKFVTMDSSIAGVGHTNTTTSAFAVAKLR